LKTVRKQFNCKFKVEFRWEFERMINSKFECEFEGGVTRAIPPFILKIYYYRDSRNKGWRTICGLNKVIDYPTMLREGLIKPLDEIRRAVAIFDARSKRRKALYIFPPEPNYKTSKRKPKQIQIRKDLQLYFYVDRELEDTERELKKMEKGGAV
jgi:hypothetical protein